ADKEKIRLTVDCWALLRAEAQRLRETSVASGTALDVAGNGRYARKVVIACKRERPRRLHTIPPHELAEMAKQDPGVLIVQEDDMRRALASALTTSDSPSASS